MVPVIYTVQLAPNDTVLKDFHETVTKDAQAKAKKALVVSIAVSTESLHHAFPSFAWRAGTEGPLVA